MVLVQDHPRPIRLKLGHGLAFLRSEVSRLQTPQKPPKRVWKIASRSWQALVHRSYVTAWEYAPGPD